jgi:hypothetical protein
MFLMLRAQKRLTITAGKITDLSLEGFTTVSKSQVVLLIPKMIWFGPL